MHLMFRSAANFVLLPYYTFNYLLNSSSHGARSLLADKSLFVLLVLIHYRKCIAVESFADSSLGGVDSTIYNLSFYDNPYRKALENARDIQCKTCFSLCPFCPSVISKC